MEKDPINGKGGDILREFGIEAPKEKDQETQANRSRHRERPAPISPEQRRTEYARTIANVRRNLETRKTQARDIAGFFGRGMVGSAVESTFLEEKLLSLLEDAIGNDELMTNRVKLMHLHTLMILAMTMVEAPSAGAMALLPIMKVYEFVKRSHPIEIMMASAASAIEAAMAMRKFIDKEKKEGG